jgi:hypothetical protein
MKFLRSLFARWHAHRRAIRETALREHAPELGLSPDDIRARLCREFRLHRQ